MLKPVDGGCSVRVEQDGSAVMEIPPLSSDKGSILARYDYVGELDFSESAGIEFDYMCSDASAISGHRFYFAGPDGDGAKGKGPNWNYVVVRWGLPPSDGEGGWGHMTVRKSDVDQFLGKPTGFGRIPRMRLFFFVKSGVTDPVTFRMRNMRLMDAEDLATDAWVVAGDVTLPEMKLPVDSHSGRASPHLAALRRAGFAVATVRESDFPAEIPESVKIVVLPENKFLPERVRTVLDGFAKRGGKIVFARQQVNPWRNGMLKAGAGVDIAYDFANASGEPFAAFYAKRFEEWFPSVAATAEKRLAARESRFTRLLAGMDAEREDFSPPFHVRPSFQLFSQG